MEVAVGGIGVEVAVGVTVGGMGVSVGDGVAVGGMEVAVKVADGWGVVVAVDVAVGSGGEVSEATSTGVSMGVEAEVRG